MLHCQYPNWLNMPVHTVEFKRYWRRSICLQAEVPKVGEEMDYRLIYLFIMLELNSYINFWIKISRCLLLCCMDPTSMMIDVII